MVATHSEGRTPRLGRGIAAYLNADASVGISTEPPLGTGYFLTAL